MRRLRHAVALATLLVTGDPGRVWSGTFDHLTELTGKVTPIVTLKGRDNFSSEYRYDIAVRNQSPDVIAGDSLVIVLDRITNLAGEDREPLKSDTVLSRFEILGQDGQTDDGKAFFRIPAANGQDLPPQTESRPASVRLRNLDYLAVFTPTFRVYGLRRPTAEAKQQDAIASSAAQSAAARTQVEKLIQLLIKKGVLTEEEWRKANRP